MKRSFLGCNTGCCACSRDYMIHNDIFARVCAWAFLAASGCVLASSGSVYKDMRDECGCPRRGKGVASLVAPIFYGLCAARRNGAAVCTPAPEHARVRRRAFRASSYPARGTVTCSARLATSPSTAVADDVTTPTPLGPNAGRPAPIDMLGAASEGIRAFQAAQ